jgi:hypothetical protein
MLKLKIIGKNVLFLRPENKKKYIWKSLEKFYN